MSAWLTGWRLALRMARRDAMRAKARSALVLIMIALPVLAVTTATIAQRTTDVSAVEALDRNLGGAQALLSVAQDYPSTVLQNADGANTASDKPLDAPPTGDALAQALGGAHLTELVQSQITVSSDDGVADAVGFQTNLNDPVVAGIIDLASGRLPRSADEVVVNQAMLDEGYVVGDQLVQGGEQSGPTIVGVAESTTIRSDPLAAGPLGSLKLDEFYSTGYLVDGSPVTWNQVKELNALGASVVSREVLENPPPDSEIPDEVRNFSGGGLDSTTLTVLILVITMALLEVVLLAGPAFAVGTRRLQRSLALMAAAGGTPHQTRRVVLGSAVVLGGVAALAGVVLGSLLAAAVVLPILQHYSSTYFGPFEAPLLPIVAVAAFGMLSAFLAAVVPAWIASRQDVVAVLAGRRGDTNPSYRSPIIGLVLVGLGVVAAVLGATRQGGEALIAGAALLSVVGMVLLVPLVVSMVARLARRFPLSLRYAALDAARHRTRTAPAVAAVAATVAGVVALLIANTSDSAEAKAMYKPSLSQGFGVVSGSTGINADQNKAIRAILAKQAPGAMVTPVQGVVAPFIDPGEDFSYTALTGGPPSATEDVEPPLLSSYGYSFGSDMLVSEGALPPGLIGVSADERTAMEAELEAGGLVAFTDRGVDASPEEGRIWVVSQISDNQTGEIIQDDSRSVPALLVHVPSTGGGPSGMLSPAIAQSFELDVGLTGLVINASTVSNEAETAINEGLGASDTGASFYVERGYTAGDETLILQLILLGLGAVLMLGGTLTATFLALSDARPDLATLAAIGASPRRRRGVAAGYALIVGFVGALLGAAIGFIPGVAIAFPLTSSGDIFSCTGNGFCSSDGTPTGPYIDVPWLMVLGLVVVLPLLTAAIVALTARSRLPLVARPE